MSQESLQPKCPSCGGAMEFSPKEQKLKCVYCGATKELDMTTVNPKEHDFNEWAKKTDEDLRQVGEETQEVKCHQCGATVVLSGQSSSKCPFCGTPLVMDQAQVKRSWKPEYIVPFKIEKSACAEIFGKWINGKFFCPSKFKNGAVVADSFKGVFLPYWTYDAKAVTAYTGQKGRHEKKKDKDGETETVTEWRTVSGIVKQNFDDILVPASKGLPESVAAEVGDSTWDLKNVVPYNPELVVGFMTEVYTVDFKEGFEVAKHKMEDAIDEEVRKDIGGDEQRVTTKETNYEDVTFKMLLLPIFLGVFMIGDKRYTFAINAFTGECHGEYPVDKMKVYACIAIVSVLVIVLLKLFGIF
ncbi:MAG: hypothetical protein PUF37_04315 [Prevotellaceae bacterium]|nr:hypothetical protein [Prevotellaceae bacterium]